MSRKELKQSATIDSIINIVNKLHSAIQLQDTSDEGVKREHTQEHVLPSSKSIDVEIRGEEETLVETTQQNSLERSKSAPPQIPPPDDLVNPIRKLQISLRRLKRKVKYMRRLQLDVDEQLGLLDGEVRKVEPSDMSLTSKDLTDITAMVLNLIRKVPMSSERQKQKKAAPVDQEGDKSKKRIVCLPGIHANEQALKRLAVFRDVKRKFEGLKDDEQRICLLSFAVFPENKEVDRKMLMYWWMGEGVLPVLNAEVKVKEILDVFTKENLIEPVKNKRKLEPSSYKMTPFVHASLVLISKKIGLFHMYDEKEKPNMQKSELNKVCLVEGSSLQEEAKSRTKMNPENIETVFNVSERFPEFTRKWFTRMKKLRVLYLGRWERIDPGIEMDKWERTDQEIEMDSRRVMKDLSSLTRLRFLSFQGISTIKSLSRSACKLNKLIILDLRHCYNMEQLPDDIHKLKSLVYLDLTGCEALESIPVGLSRLDNLEVLKGFVLGDVDTAKTCKLPALKRLANLRKLSVIVHREAYPLDKLIDDIKEFKVLENLNVRWGSKVILKKKHLNKDETEEQEEYERSWRDIKELPRQLRKLDLQRFPDRELPEWLWPQNLLYLEKLRLGSSKRLKGFGALPAGEPTKCGVEVLRLTSLIKLKVEWRELNKLFPNLRLLESYECPRVTFCPCDRNGIWRSKKIDDSTTTPLNI
ncbi:PREDICTED: disease resistance RPP13-like protein 4 [Camelina sativa]|uniref:Disease resistance RPP13-like protein 4 n=1 Tax=Camelina sativa TaxID=90675 RepID=A0ABM0X6S5_CAMSA|nr:PREDICTED: disease resistance RPP13-like protein 4 [Camelina sativa]XP_010481577.1 PREDICTED: disease resistance RPP13-like protein 4 [Camelina sativa]